MSIGPKFLCADSTVCIAQIARQRAHLRPAGVKDGRRPTSRSINHQENNVTQLAEMTDFNNGLFERMQKMNLSWLESLREIRRIESAFGTRLLGSKNLSEATAVCNEWMTKRMETVAKEQRAFTTAWLALVSDVMSTASTTPLKEPGSSKGDEHLDG
jgi:Phasin protein